MKRSLSEEASPSLTTDRDALKVLGEERVRRIAAIIGDAGHAFRLSLMHDAPARQPLIRGTLPIGDKRRDDPAPPIRRTHETPPYVATGPRSPFEEDQMSTGGVGGLVWQ